MDRPETHHHHHHQQRGGGRGGVGGVAYRVPSRAIAYFEMGFAILEMLGLVTFGLIAIFAPHHIDTKDLGIPLYAVMWVILIFIVVNLAFCALELWMANQLLIAAHPDTPPGEAVDKASLWRTFKIVILVADLIFSLLTGQIVINIWSLLSAGLRVVPILIVHLFIQALRELEGDVEPADGGGGEQNRTPPRV